MKFYFTLGSNTRELARLKSGPLIKEMIEHFAEKINSTLKPDRSLWLYSGHDFTISNLLNSLNLFEVIERLDFLFRTNFASQSLMNDPFRFQLHFPPTAASLHFELYKSGEGEHYFQIFYRKLNEEYPSPMKIPGCGAKCTLEQFYDLYKDIIPDEDSD